MDYHPVPSDEEAATQRETVGEIIYADNNVKRQLGNDVMWNSIERKETVYNKDSIRTAKDSGVGVRLTDGTVIEIGENSLIVLDKTQQNLSVNFKAGDL